MLLSNGCSGERTHGYVGRASVEMVERADGSAWQVGRPRLTPPPLRAAAAIARPPPSPPQPPPPPLPPPPSACVYVCVYRSVSGCGRCGLETTLEPNAPQDLLNTLSSKSVRVHIWLSHPANIISRPPSHLQRTIFGNPLVLASLTSCHPQMSYERSWLHMRGHMGPLCPP